MFKHKPRVTVIITVYNFDALRMSVPVLRRCGHGFDLVVCNYNSNITLTRKRMRHIGWRRRVYIVNADKCNGEFESRIHAIEFIKLKGIKSDWILFLGENDVLLDVSVPVIDPGVFAILQRHVVLSQHVGDIFKICRAWRNGTDVGRVETHIDICGTLVRSGVLFEYIAFLAPFIPQLRILLRQTHNRIRSGVVFWHGLGMFMRQLHPETSAIYMNQINYVSTRFGDDIHGYPGARVMARWSEFFDYAIAQNMVA